MHMKTLIGYIYGANLIKSFKSLCNLPFFHNRIYLMIWNYYLFLFFMLDISVI